MGRALYRAYRARKLKDVIGQEHITKTLANSLKAGRHSHAYLLTGPRGVGKTSIARILAHDVNNLPYDSEQPPLDIIEIDAASNRRIDEIRDIKEKASIAPVQARYKVYIIDEVHMLTKESFNALLKTLEEPPRHVIFILATTELHKLPETIISRCMHFPFKPISKSDIIAHLIKIASTEKIDIDSDALELIAQHGSGSFRDSISLLDQVRSFGAKVTLDDVRHALGLAPDELISRVEISISQSDIKSISQSLEEMYEFGADAVVVSKQILESIRSRLIEGNPLLDSSASISLMQNLLDVQSSANPARELELVLIGTAVNNYAQEQPQPSASPSIHREKTIQHADSAHGKLTPKTKSKPEAKITDSQVWDSALNELKKSNNTLYSIARMADRQVGHDLITLKFKFPFHRKQAIQPKNLEAIKSALAKSSGGKFKLEISQAAASAGKSKPQPKPKLQNKPHSQIEHKNISNIFGSSEVLES